MTPWTAEQWVAHAQGADAQLHGRGNLRVRFVSDRMARVTLQPQDGYREPHTWAIAPVTTQAHNDVPWQGRHRDDVSCFASPAVTHEQRDGLAACPRRACEWSCTPSRCAWSGIGSTQAKKPWCCQTAAPAPT